MTKVFEGAGGGKLGASVAVILAHVAPFMGAQTTLIQRYFLPHALDTIISQPFGMSEDLISMAVAEASSDPVLGSASLTLLVVFFNLAQFSLFTGCDDWKAFISAILNGSLGAVFALVLLEESVTETIRLKIVALQFVVQIGAVPVLAGALDRTSSSDGGAGRFISEDSGDGSWYDIYEGGDGRARTRAGGDEGEVAAQEALAEEAGYPRRKSQHTFVRRVVKPCQGAMRSFFKVLCTGPRAAN